MANPAEVSNAIDTAMTVEDFIAIAASIRELQAAKAPEADELHGALNAKSAGPMFAIRRQIERDGDPMTLALQVTALRRAGYPDGGQGVATWRNRILQSQMPTDLVAEILADLELSRDEANALIRLVHAFEDVRNNGIGYGRFEFGWLDVAMAPAAQGAYEYVLMQMDRIATYEGSDVFNMLREALYRVESREGLEVVQDEAARNLSGEEFALIVEAIGMRQTQLAANAFTNIVNEHGWDSVQALYERGDITPALSQEKDVQAFMGLMADIRNPLAQIKQVDAKLGAKVVQGAWDRSGEIRREKAEKDALRERLDERLRDL